MDYQGVVLLTRMTGTTIAAATIFGAMYMFSLAASE